MVSSTVHEVVLVALGVEVKRQNRKNEGKKRSIQYVSSYLQRLSQCCAVHLWLCM